MWFFSLFACIHTPLLDTKPLPADQVFENGPIHTMDDQRHVVEALAIREGRIVFVGEKANVGVYIAKQTHVVDLKGRVMLPGFIDSHAHVLEGGFSLSLCNLTALETKAEYLAEITRYAAEHPKSKWILGFGWALEAFPEGNALKEDLDAISPDRPVVMLAEDGHSAWLSSRALAMAGISAEMPDPPDGRIERSADGTPSGTVRDGVTTRLQAQVIDPSIREGIDALKDGIAEANKNGITGFVEARANIQERYDVLYGVMRRLGDLNARVSLSLFLDPLGDDSQIAALIKRYQPELRHRLKVDQIKIFMDGVTESHTAALLAPYADTPASQGLLNFDPAQLKRWAIQLDKAGFQLHFHAIGDRAVREGLDVVAATQAANGRRDARHHFAHLYLIDPVDRPRFAELGVLANVQMMWAFPADFNTKLNLPFLGADRYEQLFPLKDLQAAGAQIVGGSDWPVSPFSPLVGIQIALTRQDPRLAADAPVLNPAERVDVDTMVAAYTRMGAYLQHLERETGTLEVGKSADVIVLDRDIFEISPYEIAGTQVDLTVLEGQVVFAR